MADTPETTANQDNTPVDQIMDRVNELFDVVDTLIDDDMRDPLQENEENMPENNDTPTPARRLLDITGGLIDIARKLADAETPGHWQEFTDAEVESAGAFDENAISEDDAYVSSFDNPDA